LRCVAWSPDGKWLAAPDREGSILIWDADSFEPVRRIDCMPSDVRSLEWSPGGDRLALAASTGAIQILDAANEAEAHTLLGHNSKVECVTWSPDGSRLASGGVDRSVRIWETATGTQCLALQAHGEKVNSVAWSPDGSRLASASDDETIKVWDTGKREAAIGEAARRSPSWKSGLSLVEQLNAFGSHADWKGVARVFPKAIAASPGDAFLYPRGAVVSLETGDVGRYRELCDAALARVDEKPTFGQIVIAVTCLMAPVQDADLDRLAQLAEQSLPEGSDHLKFKWRRVGRALAAYRSGRFEDAIALSREGRDSADLGQAYKAQMWIIEAMAQARAGHGDEARSLFHQAEAMLETRFGADDLDLGSGWYLWAMGEILLREAKGVIEVAK
jgi:hypothetical protein